MEFIIANYPQLIVCFIICFAKIIEISIQSVRVVFLVKGERIIASILAFIECLIWGFVIAAILSSLGNNLYWLMAYCVGFAIGIFLGSIIENKIALGTTSLFIMVSGECVSKVSSYLCEVNKGFTVLHGEGSRGNMDVMIIVVARKEAKFVMQKINTLCDGKVFVISSEVSKFVGGYGIGK